MNTSVKIIALAVACLIAGYIIGNMIGAASGYKAHELVQKSKSIGELREELKKVEEGMILSLLEGKSDVKRIDEGGLFRTKYVHYLNGQIMNNAAVASVKDIKLRVDFYAKTDSKVSSDEIMLYEFIPPNQQHSFKLKLDWPGAATTYSLNIVDAVVN